MQTPSGARFHLCGDTRAVAAARFIKRPSLFRAFIKANPFLLIANWRGIRATKNRVLQRAGDTQMRMTAKELIADARVTAPTLPPAAAKLMTAMADRLDVQFAALCESRNEANQLAGENALMKSAIKTHSESVHFCVGCGKDDPCSNDDVCYALEETPATDAFLASLRAEGVEMAFEAAKPEVAKEFQRETFDQCVTAAVKYPQSDVAGKVEMLAWLEWFAAQLRSKSEVQS